MTSHVSYAAGGALKKAVIAIVLLVVVLNVLAFAQRRNMSPTHQLQKICDSHFENVDCSTTVAPEVSASALSGFLADVTKAQSSSALVPVYYWHLPLTFSDRLRAFQTYGPPLGYSSPRGLRNSNPIFAILYVIPVFCYWIYFSRLTVPRKEGWEFAASKMGLVDGHAGYFEFMRRHSAPTRYMIVGMMFTCFVLTLLSNPVIGFFIMLTALGVSASVGKKERTTALKVWKHVYSFDPQKRFVQPPPPPPRVQDEHGSARHAKAAELHAKGFAEREGPPPPSQDEAMYARMEAMSDKDLKATAERLGVVITRGRNGKISTIRPKG